jgi:hypothetical protein
MSTQDVLILAQLDKDDGLSPQEWRKIYIDQLGYSINLFLVTATGLIGFSISQLPSHSSNALKFAIVLLFVSIIFGASCTLVRLLIFRRRREDTGFAKASVVVFTFCSQIGAFLGGIGSLGATIFAY